MIYLIIKGNAREAIAGAHRHNIQISIIRVTQRGRETTATAHDLDREKIIAWFNVDERAPFPVGTLLHWSEPDRTDSKIDPDTV